MRVLASIISLLLLLSFSLHVKAQISFTATISPGKIGLQEYATLRYTVRGSLDIEHIYPPDFKMMQLISGPDSESEKLNINGQVSRSFSFVFMLKPVKPGRIKLPGAKAMIGGKEYTSNEVTLEVLNVPNVKARESSPSPGSTDDELLKAGEDIDRKISENMFLRLETDKKKVYVGEPVIARFKLYSRLKSNSRLTQNPSFNGFSVIDLQAPDVTESASGKVNGKEFNIYTVRKVLLYPLQPGTFTIEPLELENNVQFLQPSSTYDPYDLFSILNQGYGNTVSKIVTLATEPTDINVMPLPEKNKPANFSGAVGKYNVSTRILRNDFRADEEGRLVLEISGRGNLQLVNAPQIHWPSGIEAFDPQVSDTMDIANLPVTGRKKFEYVLSASRPGNYLIPPVSFSYFDPEIEKYVTVESDPITLNVAPAIQVKSVAPAVAASEKNKFNATWLLLPAAVAAVILLFFIFRNLKREQGRDDSGTREIAKPVHQPNALPENPLEKSYLLCTEGDRKNFYPVLNHELKSWLADHFCLEVNEASFDRLRECMDEANVPNNLALEVQDLLRELEWQLYAPGDGTSPMHEHFARSQLMIQNLAVFTRGA